MSRKSSEDLLFEMKLKEHYQKIGSKGGKIGGKRRAEKLTPKRRSEIARKAALARWAKDKKKGK